MKKLALMLMILLISQKPVSAGFLDKLNQATAKLNQASQQMEQRSQQLQNVPNAQRATQQVKTKTTNPITGEWGTQKTCEYNSATCQNGMDDIVNCMNQSKGYYYRLVAANLEAKLQDGQDLSEQERSDLEADIASVKEAVTTNTVVDPNPDDPQRWLKRLSRDDQKQINGLNSKYMNEVRTDCDARFGGMARYSGTGR